MTPPTTPDSDAGSATDAGMGVTVNPAGGPERPLGRDPRADDDRDLDLLVVGAGPTGIAIGAETRRRGLEALLVERGGLVDAIQRYPTDLVFFTTRDKLEIAGVPFTIADDKPTRRQAIRYYQGVVDTYDVPLALGEEVVEIRPPAEAGGADDGGWFEVESRHRGVTRLRRARAVVVATGYFDNPHSLGVPGEDLPWVHSRYLDPYRHYGQHVAVVGAGNTAAEAALDMWRNHVRVTLVHRSREVKGSVKYWLKPDLENRIEEGSLEARLDHVVVGFREDGEGRFVDVQPIDAAGDQEVESIPVDHAYVFIGYEPDVALYREAGVEIDPDTLVPAHDPETCETNVPGLYIAGTLLAGQATDQIFIENSREHAPKIVGDVVRRLDVT